jgi:putative membrane protein
MNLADLPTLNACLNATSAVFLTLGYFFIKQKRIHAHRTCMVTAFAASTIFLASYLIYHFNAGRTTFKGPQVVRLIYLAILTTHTLLAVVIVPLILLTLYQALKQRFEFHKRIARWTWPLWMYVSVTGVVIYLMLYHLYPSR